MTSPALDAPTDAAPVSVGYILSTAWASFFRRLGAHAAFGALWLVSLMLTMCITMCCVLVPTSVGVGLSQGAGSPGSSDPTGGTAMIGIVIVMYGVMLVVTIAAMALHQNVTYVFTGADLSGQTMTLGQAVRSGFDRLLPQGLHGLLRMFVDLFVFAVLVGGPFGAMMAMTGDPAHVTPGSIVRELGPKMAVVGVAYFVSGCTVLALRTFTGLGPVLVVAESLGPLAAFPRSVALLASHRLAFLGTKLSIWGVVFLVYLAMVTLMFGALGVSLDHPGSQPSNPAAVFLMLPLMLVFYAIVLLVYAFDHVCEAALYIRLVPRRYTADAVASVFR